MPKSILAMRRPQYKGRKRQGGWLQFIPLAVSAISALSQKSSNNANAGMSEDTQNFNAEEAQKNRDFQQNMTGQAQAYNTEMSNTAYQRGVADMKAAGLNPMLAYSQGGASTPTAQVPGGSSASASAPTMHPLTNAQQLSAALNTAQVAANVENTEADTALKVEQAKRETNSAENIKQQTVKIQVELPKLQQEAANLRTQMDTELQRQTLLAAQAALARTEDQVKNKEIDLTEARTRLTNIETVLKRLQEPEARNAANEQDSWWKAKVAPYMKEGLTSGTVGATGTAIGEFYSKKVEPALESSKETFQRHLNDYKQRWQQYRDANARKHRP